MEKRESRNCSLPLDSEIEQVSGQPALIHGRTRPPGAVIRSRRASVITSDDVGWQTVPITPLPVDPAGASHGKLTRPAPEGAVLLPQAGYGAQIWSLC